ncbi:MAG: SGNH/GDSL hydrolase family protein [Planctomycetota bacterium]|nr:SGNH/GDSL hydrolase family protein [Planctomycetota bacterium]
MRLNAGIFSCLLLVFAGTSAAGDAAPAAKDSEKWQSLAEYLEGRGWQNTPSPFARLPVTAQAAVPKSVWSLGGNSTGLCAHFATDANSFKVRWTLTSANLAMPHMPATGASGIDLYGREGGGGWTWIANGRPGGVTNTASFGGVPGKPAECLLYLPLYNGVSALEISLPPGTTLQAVPAKADRAKPIVFYGTSITQGGCASRPGLAYTSLIGRRLDWPVVNLGFSGSGKMELEMAGLIAELDARILVLDCLWNMSPEQVDERVEPFIQVLRKKHADTPILLVEDSTVRARTPTTKGARLKAIYDRLSPADKNLHFLSAKDLLGTDAEGTVDGCHPNDIGMLRHADAMTPVLRKILGL